MDWTLAIRRNREALSRILAALLALVGLEDRQSAIGSRQSGSAQAGDNAVSDCLLPIADCPASLADCRLFLPRHLHAYALRILRAAESAIRRLIVIAAQDVEARPVGRTWPPSSPPQRGGEVPSASKAEWGQSLRIPAFPLLDPLKRYSFELPRRASKFMPRICVVGVTEPAPIPEKPVFFPDDPVDATGLCRRLLSSRRALANLPREARRLARWRARGADFPSPLRGEAGGGSGIRRVSPLRIGHPPGKRKRPNHLVDNILNECQALALDALDTS